MVLINISRHVGRCYSNQDGMIIKDIILNHFKSGKKLTVSFDKVDGVTSSFVNTAFIELLNDFDFDFVKTHLNFINTNRQINDMIRDRFKFEVNRRKNLVSVS